MNANAKKWVEALRSGKYKQGKGRLRQETTDGKTYHCCLGVACELFIEHNPDGPIRFITEYDTVLPHIVCEWLGLRDTTGAYHEGNSCLSADNDRGMSFEKIADVIESTPRGLFA